MVDTDNHEDLLDYLKLDPDHHEKIAALIPQETWYEQLIRYGLYIGAVFQMVCILVSILTISIMWRMIMQMCSGCHPAAGEGRPGGL